MGLVLIPLMGSLKVYVHATGPSIGLLEVRFRAGTWPICTCGQQLWLRVEGSGLARFLSKFMQDPA